MKNERPITKNYRISIFQENCSIYGANCISIDESGVRGRQVHKRTLQKKELCQHSKGRNETIRTILTFPFSSTHILACFLDTDATLMMISHFLSRPICNTGRSVEIWSSPSATPFLERTVNRPTAVAISPSVDSHNAMARKLARKWQRRLKRSNMANLA